MEELDKGLAIAFKGAAAKQAVAAFRRQIKTWNVALPPTELLVLDFGLGNFAETGLIECWVANEMKAGYCGKYLFVFDGQQCPMHSHQHKHETFHIIKGRFEVTLDGKLFEMGEGNVLPIPPGHPHGFKGMDDALLLEISTPCVVSDNQFRDPAIAAWLEKTTSSPGAVPNIQKSADSNQ